MRVATLVLCLLAMAGAAYAEDSSHMFGGGPVNLPDLRDQIYCQQPSGDWNTFNGSTGFGSEQADDIPAAYAGVQVTGVTMWHGQWGGGYTAPSGLIVNFYNQVCPPGQTPDVSFNIPWNQMQTQMVYNGSWFVYQMTATLPNAVTLTSTTSIGGIIDNNWGQNPPYNGLVICATVAGCEQYWDGDYWGVPRWTPASYYFGIYSDLAYCLEGGGVATEPTTWGQVRGLYR